MPDDTTDAPAPPRPPLPSAIPHPRRPPPVAPVTDAEPAPAPRSEAGGTGGSSSVDAEGTRAAAPDGEPVPAHDEQDAAWQAVPTSAGSAGAPTSDAPADAAPAQETTSAVAPAHEAQDAAWGAVATPETPADAAPAHEEQDAAWTAASADASAGPAIADAPSTGAEPLTSTDEPTDPWGRVDADGTVYVRTPDGERPVGSWQVGEPAQALRYYRRKFEALVVETDVLERRIRSGALPPDEATAALALTREHVENAQAVGDLGALLTRVDGLHQVVEARRAKKKAQRARALEAARGTKTALVADAEQIATGSDWKDGADRLRAMLDQWKALPRLEKKADDELWHRFSAARTTYTRRRKAHFAELAGKREDAKGTKERLVAEAEELATSTAWGPTAARYRALMTEWKAAGPAPRREEETLWQRFRAAQDSFFTARSATLSERDSTEKQSLQAKEALLVEAEALLPVTDLAKAKAALRSIQERWLAAGRVPRDAVTRVEGRLRKVEETIRVGEQAEWSRTSPEALARAEATVAQLRASIEKLERQLRSAESAGNATAASDAVAALETRRSWLTEAEKTLADFRR